MQLNPEIDPANASLTVANAIEMAKAAMGATLL